MSRYNLAKTPLFSRVPRGSICWKSAPVSVLEALENSARSNSQTLRSGSGKSARYLPVGFPQRILESSSGKEARSFSSGFHLKSLETIGGMGTRIFQSGFCVKTLDSRNFSDGFDLRAQRRMHVLGTKVFSSGSEQRTVDNAESKTLPWIAAYKDGERKGVKKRPSIRSNRSLWEQSAERYFSRSGGILVKENSESGDRNEEKLKSTRGFATEENYQEVGEEDDEPIDDPRWDRIQNKSKGFIDQESRFEKPQVHQWNKQEKWGRKTWKDATESSVPKMVGQGVYGVGPILAALTAARREFYALYVQEGLDLSKNNKKKDKKAVEKVLQIAEKIGLKVIEASKHDLNMAVDNRPHQGLVLDASPL
uniref:Uncharacterized protein LOC109505238 n=1 Tax=Elaeis guineensis var. tenera TaxID=51953 RepID=A0A6J0PDS3_ELAGV|nr:uncharacterized protein LOC109505238 [Elaeis guineensis]